MPGKFLNAAATEASEENERQLIRMTTSEGHDIAYAQVAGLVARRILCDLEIGQNVGRGERFGLIRFGSRTDIYLDKGLDATVQVGQTMIATDVTSPFFAPLKLALVLAVFAAIPIILYQLWSFIAPGLYQNEKKTLLPYLIATPCTRSHSPG
ncbi:MAG: hypothetical protein COA64_03675 [Henriciella sp.]|nr:MAG: hypothetical protein COA64_03675 [Henriciella sp.]